jgi:hypothetical protein
MFVDPRPRSAFKLIPVREFMELFDALPSEHVETMVIDLLRRQTDAFPAVARNIRHRLDAARARGDFRHEVVRVLLWLGELVAFALAPGADCYRVEAFVWDELDPSRHDARESLEKWIFAIRAEPHKPNTIERELANRPILLEGASANRLLEIRPPSLARQSKIARAVIDGFTASHPAERMKKEAFVRAVKRQLPELSKQAIIRLWGQLAPEDWKRPGRKSHA